MDKSELGKPSGITLWQHTNNVLAEGEYIIFSFPFSFEKYLNLLQKDLSKRLKGAIRYHDEGKKHSVWQKACQDDFNTFLSWQKENQGDYHAFEKLNKKLAGKNLMTTGVRHEIFSLVMYRNSNFSDPVKVAIAAHHSKLSRKHENRWTDKKSGEESELIWNDLININACFRIGHHAFKEAILKHYEFAGVRAYLQMADRRASAREANDIPVDFQKFTYEFPHKNLRNVQQIAKEFANEELLLLRAPTGAGKTDACLIWAAEQIKNKKAERLILAMPTRFTSNALSINVAESLSSTGLYHSSAWFSKFHKNIKIGKIDKNIARKEHELARQLLAPVAVCTIDHLLMALTLTREDHHTITFNLANSCVVIDEADFYDEFTQANILVLLEALNILKVPVMIMSASLPKSAIEMYKTTGYQVKDIKEDVSDNDRIRCCIQSIEKYSDLSEVENLLKQCIENKVAIIYVNTVASAMNFYNWFVKKGINPILYHSRFTEPDKGLKEITLLNAIGKDAWEKGMAEGIVILTQIGEMSVNISSDFMISEICPVDRLVQRAGRLCRFNNNKIGEMHVLIPQKNSTLYPAPYGNFIMRQGWESNQALLRTIELLECKGYSAADFVNFINRVYPTFQNFKTKTIANAILLKKKFVSSWIILPAEQTKEDDTESQEWKSRDIAGNETVFIEFPEEDHFYFWQDFQEFKLEKAIDIPSYLVRKGIENKSIRLKKLKIANDDEITIFVAINSYTFDIGLQLTGINTLDEQL
ncbi:MAG TPA: CRISPR-associated helicase Cas3' [Saprospiraceae bacterium]|nr:CRISPR-associated helicase Cas3' [Saprospiraceae bacterium]MBK8828326.1 CRISPR-associated helicase Cas3' [Saprospiraceae bacterium]MBK8887123.1 CRISPR-associated helicase Cas3' [Saprospiraceae bacterium]MBK9583099.1 CRISPR-associated helicase Cas3' [Saprospiraceae bacterium]HQV67111.1 CRISPR-associated helicase Cas3' [Saprospiraceae bacterium]